MKIQRIKKLQNKIISKLIYLLGIGGACSFGGCAYGAPPEDYEDDIQRPMATFSVNGHVMSEDSSALEKIMVVMKEDTCLTDSAGYYEVEYLNWETETDYSIEFIDYYGISTDYYEYLDTLVSFENEVFEGGDGGDYKGKASIELDVYLNQNK
jgi:putative lipoprotein (rSAM/lipoprotein system)